MRVTGLNVQRGARRAYAGGAVLLAIVLAAPVRADTHSDVVDLFASMAGALSDDNPAGFMSGFDPNMPAYGELDRGVKALVLHSDVSSFVEPVQDEGNDSKRQVELDWYLELTNPDSNSPPVRRRQVITCELRKEGKHWRIVSLKPLSFFAVPAP